MTTGLYVYGVAAAGTIDAPPPGPAIESSRPPGLVAAGSLTAIVSEVDVGELEGEALERNARDPEWLEAKVRAHEAVLDAALTKTTVVPMRFGAIFSSERGLRDMLTDNAAQFGRCLERVRDRSEWGVKVHAAAAVVEEVATPAAPASGRDYLLRKKERLDARAGAAEAAAALARDVHAALSEIAAEAALVTARSATPPVLNAAYLVDDGLREPFMQRVSELQLLHGDPCTFEVTGPWPPYNFTSADVAGPRS